MRAARGILAGLVLALGCAPADEDAPRLTAAPAALDLGRWPRGLVDARQVLLRYAAGPATLPVAVSVRPPGAFAVAPGPLPLTRGVAAPVNVLFAADAPGVASAVLRAEAAGASLEVPLRAEVIDPGFDWSGSTDLGVLVGAERREVALRLRNRTDAAFAVRPVPGDAQGLALVPAGLARLAPGLGAEQDVRVEASCRAGGDAVAALDLALDGCTDCPGVRAVLRARCVEPARVLVAPERLDFGAVSPGERLARSLRVRNESPLPVGAVALRVVGPDRSWFAVEPAQLAVGGAFDAQVSVAFAPVDGARYAAGLELVGPGEEALARVPLSGRGGGARLVLEPAALDFGRLATGETAVRTLVAANAGDAPVELSVLTVQGPFSLAGSPPARLDAGASAPLALVAATTAPGAHAGSLSVTTDDADTPRAAVALRAEVVDTSGCLLQPEGGTDVDFGPLISREATLVRGVRNAGSTACLVDPPRVEPTNYLFRAASDALPPGERALLPPGAVAPLRLAARGQWFVVGVEAVASVAATDGPPVRFRLAASPWNRALLATPNPLRLPDWLLGCPSGEADVLVTTSDPAAGTVPLASASVDPAPGASFTALLAPGSATVRFTARAQAPGEHATVARIRTADGRDLSLALSFRAVDTDGGRQVARFPARPARVDVLFVMDNSGSMWFDGPAVLQATYDAVVAAVTGLPDFRLGILPFEAAPRTRVLLADDAGRRVVDSTLSDIHYTFALGSAEPGLDLVRIALDPANPGGFGTPYLRDDARLVVALVTDEPSPSRAPPAAVAGFLRALKHGAARDDLAALVMSPQSAVNRHYEDFAAALGGRWIDARSRDWPGTAALVRSAAADSRLRFGLEGPAAPGTLAVLVDGAPVDPGAPAAPAWRYVAARHAVEFEASRAPDNTAESVEISYWPGCP